MTTISDPVARIRIIFLSVLGILLFTMFSVSVCAPLVRPFFSKKIDEHRGKTPPPDIHLLLSADAAPFASALNTWADDTIGLRDPFIRLKTQMDYSLFHTARKEYIGSDGFLFNRDLTDHLLDIDRADVSQIAQTEQAYQHLADYLRARGITLVIVVNPDKARFYPEYLSPDAPHFPSPGKLEQFRRFFAQMKGIIYVDAENLLLPEKESDPPLYYRLDLHPRTAAAIPVVKEIIRRIALKEGRSDIAWNENFHFDTQMTMSGGSDTRFLGLLHPLNEEDKTAPDLYEIGKAEPDGHWTMGASDTVNTRTLGANDLFDFEFASNPELCKDRLPTTMIYGNSFTDFYWRVGFQRYFCFTRRTRPGDPAHMQAFVGAMPPTTRYFIYQVLSSQIISVAPPILQ